MLLVRWPSTKGAGKISFKEDIHYNLSSRF
uniref:Uncharacterized protein n=1 Tax=Anguilla anguilla TaxID=7936 RepID=A0A0E9RDA5_ANGAN